MKVRWCQRQPAVVVVMAAAAAAALVSSSHAEDLPDSFEASSEAFRPSSLFLNSPSSFRPMPRGGRSYDFSSSPIRSSSAATATGSVFPPFPSNTFPSTPFASSFPSSPSSSPSHESSSSYASISSSRSSPSLFSSPSLSFSSNPSSSFPSITKASGIEILDVGAQDSSESLGLALRSTLGFPPSGFTSVRNSHGHTGVISPPSRSYSPPPPNSTPVSAYEPPSLSQTYGPPPQPTTATAYKPPPPSPTYGPPPPQPTTFTAYTPPSPTQSYGPPPKPTPFPAFGSSSPFPFGSRGRERFTSSEFPHPSSLEVRLNVPDNSFATSVESFIGSSSPSRSFSGFNSPSNSYSGPRGSFSSHEALAYPTTLKPSPSLSFLSSERLNSQELYGSSTRGFSTPSSLLVTPAKSFQSPPFGSHTPYDSRQSSSAELLLRTRDQPRPVLSQHPTQATSVKNARQPQASFVGGYGSYYFNYDVNESVDNKSSAFGGRRKKGPNFGHSERRDGQRTEGRYYVELPDGRTQVVEYYADKTGYHPTITYI